jgi:hypothetical protein
MFIIEKKNNFYKNYLKLLKNNIFLYNFYINRLFFNNFKFNTNSLINIKKIIGTLFNKKIILNISNIKYIHINNNLFLKALTNKINKHKEESVLKLIAESLSQVKIAKLF